MMEDIKKALGNKEDFWLNASVLLYVALLPFNAFSFHVFPGPYFRLNLTKGALLLVIVLGLRAYFKGRIKIKKAYLLYLFLTIQIFANLLSVINSPDPTESFMLAVTLSQYCVLVFILIHVVRSEVLLRVILRVMAIVVLVVIAHSIGIFLWRGGVFFTRTQPSMLGNGIGHYLSYFLIMFGTGLVYSLLAEKSKFIKCFLWLSTGLWAFVIHLNAMKAGSITIVVFALLLLLTAYKEWRKTIPLVGVVVAVFFLVLQLVPIVNTYLAFRHEFEVSRRILSEQQVLTPGAAPSEQQVLTPGAAPSEQQVLTPGAAPSEQQVLTPGAAPSEELDTLVYQSSYNPANNVMHRWTGGNSLEIRVRGWLSGIFMATSHFWMGVGVGQTGHYFNDYSELVRESTQSILPQLPYRKYLLSDKVFRHGTISIHNIFINAWAETGIFGLFAIIGVISVILGKSVPAAFFSKRSGVNSVHFFLPLLLSILLYHQVVYFWFHPWLWTTIALAYAAADINRVLPIPERVVSHSDTEVNLYKREIV